MQLSPDGNNLRVGYKSNSTAAVDVATKSSPVVAGGVTSETYADDTMAVAVCPDGIDVVAIATTTRPVAVVNVTVESTSKALPPPLLWGKGLAVSLDGTHVFVKASNKNSVAVVDVTVKSSSVVVGGVIINSTFVDGKVRVCVCDGAVLAFCRGGGCNHPVVVVVVGGVTNFTYLSPAHVVTVSPDGTFVFSTRSRDQSIHWDGFLFRLRRSLVLFELPDQGSYCSVESAALALVESNQVETMVLGPSSSKIDCSTIS